LTLLDCKEARCRLSVSSQLILAVTKTWRFAIIQIDKHLTAVQMVRETTECCSGPTADTSQLQNKLNISNSTFLHHKESLTTRSAMIQQRHWGDYVSKLASKFGVMVSDRTEQTNKTRNRWNQPNMVNPFNLSDRNGGGHSKKCPSSCAILMSLSARF
jgi:hypothetical protein